LKTVVAFTPLAGAVVLPVVVPLLMVRVSVGAGVLAAVLLSSLWFAAMLSNSSGRRSRSCRSNSSEIFPRGRLPT
jgi:4-amino-4-deoxy-L-arabinose transferase-like glycosyltransferase